MKNLIAVIFAVVSMFVLVLFWNSQHRVTDTAPDPYEEGDARTPDAVNIDRLAAGVLTETYAELATYDSTTYTWVTDGMIAYVRSRAADGDGGEGFFRYVEGDTSSGNDGTIIEAGDDAWNRIYTGDINALWFAVGNGSTDDTAAFTALETAHDGEYVDLQGNTYKVDALPTKCKYFNGQFSVGSTYISLRRNKLDHPMSGDSWLAYGDGIMHYWLFGLAYISSDTGGTLIAIVNPAWGHEQSYSSPLNVIFSNDKGQTWYGEKTIHSVADYDMADATIGIMGSDRIGVLVYLRNDGGTVRNDFVYSDDDGDTWTVSASELTAGNAVFPYGHMLPYIPGGGSDDFIIYGYQGSDLMYAYTTDNGATWASGDMETGGGYAEPSVVRVNNESKWVAFIRKNSANMYISTSSNMTTWTEPVDSGVLLSSNPVQAVVEGGSVYIYMVDRGNTGLREKNETVLIEDNIADVYSNGNLTSLAQRQVLDGPDRTTGYFYFCQVGTEHDYVWGATAMESYRTGGSNEPKASYMLIGSTRGGTSLGNNFVNSPGGANLLKNGTFDHWGRGTSFVDKVGTTSIADGWTYYPSGATATITREAIDDEISKLVPFHPAYGCKIDTSGDPDNYTGLYQELKGSSYLYVLADQTVTIQIWGLGDLPGTPYANAIIDYGDGGSADASTGSNYFKITEGSGLLWKATVHLVVPTLEDKTIGTDPLVRFGIYDSTNAAFDVTFLGIKCEIGPYATAFRPPIENGEPPLSTWGFNGGLNLITASDDDVPVDGVGLLQVSTSLGDVTIGGLSGGRQGQVLFIQNYAGSNAVILEYNEGDGTEKFLWPTTTDKVIEAKRGVAVAYTGTYWIPLFPDGGGDIDFDGTLDFDGSTETGDFDLDGEITGRAGTGTLAAEGSLTAAQMRQHVYTISGAYDQTFPDCGTATDGCSAMFILETDDEIEFIPATDTDIMLHYGDVTCRAGYGITTEAGAVGEVYTAVCYGSKGNGTWVWVTASDMAEGADAFP
jgi:hypothetical protein